MKRLKYLILTAIWWAVFHAIWAAAILTDLLEEEEPSE